MTRPKCVELHFARGWNLWDDHGRLWGHEWYVVAATALMVAEDAEASGQTFSESLKHFVESLRDPNRFARLIVGGLK